MDDQHLKTSIFISCLSNISMLRPPKSWCFLFPVCCKPSFDEEFLSRSLIALALGQEPWHQILHEIGHIVTLPNVQNGRRWSEEFFAGLQTNHFQNAWHVNDSTCNDLYKVFCISDSTRNIQIQQGPEKLLHFPLPIRCGEAAMWAMAIINGINGKVFHSKYRPSILSKRQSGEEFEKNEKW